MQKTDTAELRRLHEAATKGMNWQDAAVFDVACRNHLPAVLDELEAAREEVRELSERLHYIRQIERTLAQEKIHADRRIRNQRRELDRLPARDRRMKLIGAAEWLESNNERLDTMNRADVEEEAAKLRQEAGDATR